MNLNKYQTEKLEEFRRKYPMINMGDLQSFILGMQAMDAFIETIYDLKNESELNALENQSLEA
jgi:hypothetical protein